MRVLNVDVPAGYALVDMNARGDLLLGVAWLPKGKKQPQDLPFAGRFISDDRQILGPGRTVFVDGALQELPNPCAASGSYTCSNDFVSVVQAANGDIVGYYQMDAPGTPFDPIRTMAAWRAASEEWQTLESGFRWAFVPTDMSNSGWIAANFFGTFGPQVSRVYSPTGAARTLPLPSLCPAPFTDALDIFVAAVNDIGEAAGRALCRTTAGLTTIAVRWPATAEPITVAPAPISIRDIDEYGNIAGIAADRATVWLADGTVVDLSAAVGGQPSTATKFLKRGQVLGSVAGQAVIWRFGF